KCWLLVAFGGALLGAGEWALRKVNRAGAVSLYSAGLGTLYLTAFASLEYFELVSQTGAFWLLAGVAALGVAITVRSRALAVGVLSLVGGYLAPILLSGASTFAGALPLYLTALLCVTLGLSALLPAPFRTLRYAGLGLHAVVAMLWLMHDGRSEWVLAL